MYTSFDSILNNYHPIFDQLPVKVLMVYGNITFWVEHDEERYECTISDFTHKMRFSSLDSLIENLATDCTSKPYTDFVMYKCTDNIGGTEVKPFACWNS